MARVALVTGGTRGIGRATSVALRKAGFHVAASYVSDTEAAVAFSQETGVEVFQWDVADHAACEQSVGQIISRLGPVSVLVNNAGVTRDSSMLKMSQESWHKVLDINVTGSFNMVKAVLPGMRDQAWGRIVNVGSINGQAGQFGQVNYSAAKAALSGFTKALALETARYGITVNTVAPGYIRTDMVSAVPAAQIANIVAGIPAGRLGEAHEVGRAIAFLCADESSFITGSTLSINGGQHMV